MTDASTGSDGESVLSSGRIELALGLLAGLFLLSECLTGVIPAPGGYGIPELFTKGGPWAYSVLAADVICIILIPLSLKSALSLKRQTPTLGQRLTVLMSLSPLLLGTLSRWHGHQRIAEVIPIIELSRRQELQLLGEQIAAIPYHMGVWSSIVFLIPALAALLLGGREQSP